MTSFILSISFTLAFLATPLLAQQYGGGFDEDFSWHGYESYAAMGSSIAVLGDLNGDGVADLISSAPGARFSGTVVFGRVEVCSGSDGSLIFSHNGQRPGVPIGRAVASAGDQNGDGIPDYAFTDTVGRGEIEIHSGADGSLLLRISSPTNVYKFANSMTSTTDLNGDGVDDFFVGAPGKGSFVRGAVFAISGSDGAMLWQQLGPVNPQETLRFGERIASIPDLNGDGHPECLFGAMNYSQGFNFAGAAFLVSGIDGSHMNSWFGQSDRENVGSSVAYAGDHNGDGTPDLAIGASGYLEGVFGDPTFGAVAVYSGLDFSLIRSYSPSEPGQLGVSCDNVGDVNGDGFDDLMAGASAHGLGGRVYFFSGREGDRLDLLEAQDRIDYFGSAIRYLGDIDSDGRLDILVGASNALNGGNNTGAVYKYSFRDFMTANVASISATAGGTVTFDIDFPTEITDLTGSLHYRLLFSGSGVGPTKLFGWNVPLSVDALWNIGLSGNYPSVFTNPGGQLDLNGHAAATLTFAPGDASAFVGSTIYFSAMQYEEAAGGDIYIHGPSVAVGIDILP